MNNLSEKFDGLVSRNLRFIDNEYASAFLSLFFVLYAGLAAPQLSPNVSNLFNNILVKLVVFFMIVYNARRNPTVALVSAVGFLVALHIINSAASNYIPRLIVNARQRLPWRKESGEEELPEELPEVEGMIGQFSRNQNSRDYRNNFYPQYVNMDSSSYSQRKGNNIVGHEQSSDRSSSYASV